MSQITVETAQVVKPCDDALADDIYEYCVNEIQGNPTMGEFNVLKENAYPKVV
jgi:hypothetical protein